MINVFKVGLRLPPPVLNVRLLALEASKSSDMPIDMENPYKPKPRQCFLCRNNVELDYKNVQLLSQFVSPYTGRIYGRHITGLCIPMQKRIATLIKRSRKFGFMANESKETVFFDDPSILANKRT
ncbi:28S ribosomal protein S18c mitochondrial [Taenia solium]|eukprot:TsM_000441900 transcript=TsM_000441900 gene=TsM_000441900